MKKLNMKHITSKLILFKINFVNGHSHTHIGFFDVVFSQHKSKRTYRISNTFLVRL